MRKRIDFFITFQPGAPRVGAISHAKMMFYSTDAVIAAF
jgi:hypothetical protein